ncbi:hypothetical protein ABBQ32_009381 [Trebouxia sp. C0010 RCD-2024]
MLHPIVPGTDVPFVSSQPAPSVPPQAVPTGYIRTPPPPPARHLFAKQKRPQKPSGHVTQPSVLDRVSNRRHILTAEAKPFVGSAHDVPSAAAPAAAREPRDMLSAGSGHSFSQSGQQLHRLPSQLHHAARPYVPAGLSDAGIQEPAAAQQSRMLPTLEAKVDASFMLDRQHDRQVESMPAESTGGNFGMSTVAPELIRAMVESEPAQLTDEPEGMSSKHQLGVDNKDAVHTPGATFVLNVDSRITQQGAADTGPAPQPISAAHSPPPPPPYALANKRQPQSLQLSRPVSQASLLDRVSKTWSTPNANAKPVVGCRANLSSSTAPSDVREARAVGGADSRRSSAQGGHELHRLPSHLNSAARPYVPAGLSGSRIQKPAAAQQSRMLSALEAKVERVLTTHLPEVSTDGNTRSSTAAPELIRATVKSEPAQLADEPESMSSKHQLGVDNKDAVHTAGAILAVNEDSRTQQVAADTSPAPQPISTAHSKPPPPHALANKRQPQCLQRPRPVSIGALADRFFEDFRLMQNADAKPFMGSLMGSPPSTAPSDLREAMAMGGAEPFANQLNGAAELASGPAPNHVQRDTAMLPATLSGYATQKARNCPADAQRQRLVFTECGQGLHCSPSQLNAAARSYVPAGLSSYRTQEQAAVRHSRIAIFGAQVAFNPQHDRLSECVLIPEETARGNIRLSTAAPDLIQATVKKEPAQPADEPVKMSSEHQLGADKQGKVHKALASYALTADSCMTTQPGAADTDAASQLVPPGSTPTSSSNRVGQPAEDAASTAVEKSGSRQNQPSDANNVSLAAHNSSLSSALIHELPTLVGE